MVMEGELQGGVDHMSIDDLKSDLDSILQFLACDEAFQLSTKLAHEADEFNSIRESPARTAFESQWANAYYNYEGQPSPNNSFVSPLLTSEMGSLSYTLCPLQIKAELQDPFSTVDLTASSTQDFMIRRPPAVSFQDVKVTVSPLNGSNSQHRQHVAANSDHTYRRIPNGIDGVDDESSILGRFIHFAAHRQVDSSFGLMAHSPDPLKKLQVAGNSDVVETLSEPILKEGARASSAVMGTPNSSLSSSVSEEAVDEETSSCSPACYNRDVQFSAGSKRKLAALDQCLSSEESIPPAKMQAYKKDAKPAKKGKKRVREARYAIQTRSEKDVLEDGYKWRKYGQKTVKNSPHPRSYYRCTFTKCSVKKTVERSCEDSSLVITTYQGIHIHPCTLTSSNSPSIATRSSMASMDSSFLDAIPSFSPVRSPAGAIRPHLFAHDACSPPGSIPDHRRFTGFHDHAAAMQSIRGARLLPSFDRGLLEDMLPSTLIRNTTPFAA